MEVLHLFVGEQIIQQDILVWMLYTCIQELLAQIFTGHIFLVSSGGYLEIFKHVKIPFKIPTYWQCITMSHFIWHYNVCSCDSVVK